MPKKSSSLLLCFPTSSSTPSLAGAAGVVGAKSARSSSVSSSLGSSLLSAVYFFFLLFANLALLCVGSLFLSWLEQPAEVELRRQIAMRRAIFVEEFLHNNSLKAAKLNELLSFVQDAAQKGVMTRFPAERLDENLSVWSFGSAFLFLTTIATTVGYGHAAPQSNMGKAFSMIYGTIAIPLLLAFFSELIRKMVAVLNWIFVLSVARRCRRQSERCTAGSTTQSSNVRVKVVFVLLVSIMLIFSTVFVPAFIFTALEEHWSFLDGLYYCFISMTTVGLGDVVPGEGSQWNADPNTKELYHISVSIYLLTALPLFFLAIKLISSLVTTAEMTFRLPFCVGDSSDTQIGDERGTKKPRIKVSRDAPDDGDDDDDDDDDMYDASSGLIGRPAIRHDSETQITDDGDESTNTTSVAEEKSTTQSTPSKQQQQQPIAAIPSDLEAAKFAYLFPQPPAN